MSMARQSAQRTNWMLVPGSESAARSASMMGHWV